MIGRVGICVTFQGTAQMIRFLNSRGSAPTLQGQAAFVKSTVSDALLAEVGEAITDARVVGWDLSAVVNVDWSALEEVDSLARRWNTLVVVVGADERVVERLQTEELSNVILSRSESAWSDSKPGLDVESLAAN